MTLRTLKCKRLTFLAYVFWVAIISTDPLNQVATAQQPSASQVQSASTPTPTEFRPPPFQQLRYLEDYSYLQDKSLCREPFDRLKYLPFRKGKPDWYLSIGGEIRQRYEAFRNDNWGRAPDDSNGYLLQRYMLHTDWYFGKNVRAFVQLRSNVEAGRVGGPRPVVDENKLDFNQAFVDLSFGDGEKAKVSLRVGRQEMTFGTGRLVTFRESPNVRLSFDGLRATVKTSKWTFDGIAVKPVESDLGYFDDGPTRETSFWGVGGQRTMNLLGQSKLGVFYLGLDRKSARFDAGTGREIRQTVGTQFFGNAGAVDHNTEFVYQFGNFKSGSIRAWMITTDTGYTFRRERFTPRVGLRANIASGDKNPNDNQLEAFNALFPAGNYFGEIGLLGQSNFMNLYPRVEFKMPRRISLSLETMFYWRQSTSDGIYNPAGVLLRPGNLSSQRYVGTQPAVVSSWAFDRHFTFFVSYSHFFSGRFLKETPPGDDIDYFTAMMTYRF
ncbi:MAG TPA: alginate export family protein [Pyrinomonadaceae bacterium]|nr:alginate export family protein [Pyrinomonadaceae bacterium]